MVNPILASSNCRLVDIFVHLSTPLNMQKASVRHSDKNLVSFQNLRNHDAYWEIANVKLNQRQIQMGFRGFAQTPTPLVFKYPVKMKYFALSEAKLFHFHGIFEKNEIKSEKRTQHLLYI